MLFFRISERVFISAEARKSFTSIFAVKNPWREKKGKLCWFAVQFETRTKEKISTSFMFDIKIHKSKVKLSILCNRQPTTRYILNNQHSFFLENVFFFLISQQILIWVIVILLHYKGFAWPPHTQYRKV